MPDYEFSGRARLGRGFSYPLKRSVLDKLPDERKINAITYVGYCGPSKDHRVCCAHNYGPYSQVGSHSLAFSVNAVPSAIRKRVSRRLESDVLSDLVDWILHFENESKLVSQMQHQFEVYYTDVTETGDAERDVPSDEPFKPSRLPRFRGKIRP